MNVNEKGNIGLIKVIADLYSKGYHCFTPFDDHCAVDLIALDKNGKHTDYKLNIGLLVEVIDMKYLHDQWLMVKVFLLIEI